MGELSNVKSVSWQINIGCSLMAFISWIISDVNEIIYKMKPHNPNQFSIIIVYMYNLINLLQKVFIKQIIILPLTFYTKIQGPFNGKMPVVPNPHFSRGKILPPPLNYVKKSQDPLIIVEKILGHPKMEMTFLKIIKRQKHLICILCLYLSH